MQDQFVFSECTLIFVRFLRKNNAEINEAKINDYLNKLFLDYALLATKSDNDVSITNDLFEHTGTIKTSRTANAMKRDLNKIAELLANKTQWTVSVLTYDNEVIESEKDFDYTLNGLQTNTILATSRNRGAYNLAIGHQLGLLLIRLSSIISDPKTK